MSNITMNSKEKNEGGVEQKVLEWLTAQAKNVKFGEVGITFVIHDGQITRISYLHTEKIAVQN